MSRNYSSNVVIIQSSNRNTYSSSRSSPSYSSSYAQSTWSMDSSTASGSSADARYRSGSSSGYYTDVKEVPSSRGGSSVVVVQHNRANPDKDEPRSSDYYHSGSSYSKK